MLQFLIAFILPIFVNVENCYAQYNQVKFEPKIVGGETTTIEEHPYQVSLDLMNHHWCAGSIITSTEVLTAAHCTHSRSKNSTGFSIRAGTTYNDRDGISIEVDRICIHPKYDAFTTDYDVSIVVVKEAFVFSKSIHSIPLLLEEEVPDGTIGRITGWGAVEENGDLSDILQQVDVPKVNTKKCQRYYKKSYREITDRMSCYGYIEGGEKDACQADSGGPLVVNGRQAAIVSWGKGCARPGYPGVYVRLANPEISSYIKGTLENCRSDGNIFFNIKKNTLFVPFTVMYTLHLEFITDLVM